MPFATRNARGAALAAAPVALVLVAAVALAGAEDLTRAAAIRSLASVTVLQVLPGAVLWRLLGPRSGTTFEDLTLGGALGAALAIVAVALPGPVLPWALLLAIGPLLTLTVPAWRARVVGRETEPTPLLLPGLAAAPALLVLPRTTAFFRAHPLEWVEGFRGYYVDMPYHIALAAQVGERSPDALPYVLSEPLQYHWFSHAWVAHVAGTAGVELAATMLRVLPVVALVATPLAVAAVAWRLTGRVWATGLASFLAIAAGDLTLTYVGANLLVFHLSPSLAASVVLSCALVVLILTGHAEGRPAAWHHPLVFALAFVVAGTKGSALPVLVGGAVFATAVLWVATRAWPRRAAADAATLTAALVVASLTIFGGGSPGISVSVADALGQAGASMALVLTEPPPGPGTWVLAAVVLLVASLARGAGVLPAAGTRALWCAPGPLLLLGTGLAGAGAVLVFAHDGRSQFYFLRNAAPFLAVLSAWGLSTAATRLSRRDLVVVAATGVGLGAIAGVVRFQRLYVSGDSPVGAVVLGLALVLGAVAVAAAAAAVAGSANRGVRATSAGAVALLAVTALPGAWALATTPLGEETEVAAGTHSSFGADQLDAARALRDASPPDALVATNRHCNSNEQRCDNRRFSVAAFTERQMLVEGWGYTDETAVRATAELDDAYVPYWREDLLRTNDAFFTEPTAASARALADLGVDWAFVDRTAPHDPAVARFGTVVHESPNALVLRLP